MWGAAQAVAFGCGGILGTLASDIARLVLGSPGLAYATVFAGEAMLFVLAAGLAMRIGRPIRDQREFPAATAGTLCVVGVKAERA